MALPMRRFTLLTIVALLALLAAAAVYQVVLVRGKPRQYIGPGISPAPDTVILTNLVGRDVEAVASQLEDAGLDYEIEPVGPPDDGTVVAQDPGPGVLVEEGSVIRLQVNCVPDSCPDD